MRAAHRLQWLPADGRRVRRGPGRDHHDRPGHPGLPGRAPNDECDRDGGCGMVSAGNQKATQDAGPSFILGTRISDVRCVVETWREQHPGEDLPTGRSSLSPGLLVPPVTAATTSSTTSTRPTGPGGPCGASTSRSPKPRKPSPAPCWSSGTGSRPPPAGPSRSSSALPAAAGPVRAVLPLSAGRPDSREVGSAGNKCVPPVCRAIQAAICQQGS
jgi:hypothetical protein